MSSVNCTYKTNCYWNMIKEKKKPNEKILQVRYF
jgi:hypothetical protein